MFSKTDNFSVNKNKIIDENLKKYGIFVAMLILIADVTCFVIGITAEQRKKLDGMNDDQRARLEELNRIRGANPGSSRSSQMP